MTMVAVTVIFKVGEQECCSKCKVVSLEVRLLELFSIVTNRKFIWPFTSHDQVTHQTKR